MRPACQSRHADAGCSPRQAAEISSWIKAAASGGKLPSGIIYQKEISADTTTITDDIIASKGINADHFPVGDVAQLTARLAALIQENSRRERYRANSPLVLQGLTDYEEMGVCYATLFHETALSSGPGLYSLSA